MDIASLITRNLTAKFIIPKDLKSINSNMLKLMKRAIRYVRTYGLTDPNYRKASHLKNDKNK